MKHSKRIKLKEAGFKVGTVQEFLNLSDEEMALIERNACLVSMKGGRVQTEGARNTQLPN